MSEYRRPTDSASESLSEIVGTSARVIDVVDGDGAATVGINIGQAIATGISVNAATTTAVTLSGTATTGIALSGTKTTGIAVGGTLTNGISFATALSGTNTTGSLISTGSTWIDHATADQCAVKFLCSSSATTGDYATLRIRAKSLGASATSGVVGGNFSASADVANYANLYAVQGYAQPLAKAQTEAANIVCGVYSCVQRTVGSSGRSWSLWTDTHETALASASHYLHRLSHNGGAITLNGIWTIYAGQGCSYLFNFENTNAPVTSGDKTGGAKTYSLACYINGAVHYIQCYAA